MSEATMYCTECGAPNKAGVRFCTSCGALFANPADEQTSAGGNLPFAAADDTPAAGAAFAPVEETPAAGAAFAPVEETPAAGAAFAPVEDAPAAGAAFAPVDDAPAAEESKAPAFAPVESVQKAAAPKETDTAFTRGLPDWDIEPPHVMVRRRRH